MITSSYCKLMAEYNQWMNTRLFALCASLSEEELRNDHCAFFKSIYLTLNHIAYSDLAFLSRFTGLPELAPKINSDLFGSFSQLHIERQSIDRRLVSWAEGLSSDWLLEPLTYTSQIDDQSRTVPKWILVTHLLNHQTHHRGQVTTLLSQMGLDMGSTDIPFMPKFAATDGIQRERQ
jgi:uncharacterized damage-inducible protein DinB